MSYLNTHARTTGPGKNEQFKQPGRVNNLFGVFMAYVKDIDDIQKNGRLRVWIPEFGSDPEDPNGWTIVNYCSPFAGSTNIDANSKSELDAFDGTQTSYGMWFVPPDINNQVLVMFINGDAGRGIWIGSLYNQFMNNMVPGMPTDSRNYQFPGKPVPVAEYNKNDLKVTQPDRAFHPYQQTKFRGLSNQGLINDRVRGITTSGARRESPSQVYGILTPGPVINPDSPPEKAKRKGGHALVMDDGVGTEYTQLTTKSGAQIRIDETNGFVYLNNRDGTAWVQMDKDGNVDIFGARDISMRAQRDLNIRADRNVNIEAGQNIFMKAAMDTVQDKTKFVYDVNNLPQYKEIPYWKNVGEGKGKGGNIVMQALNNWHSTTKNTAYLTVVDNNMNISVNNAFKLTTKTGGQDYRSNKGIKITTDSTIDIGAKSNIRVGSEGTISVVGIGGIINCTQGDISLKAQGNIRAAAGSSILNSAVDYGIDADAKIGGTLGVTGAISSSTTANLKANWANVAGGLGPTSDGSASAPPGADPASSEAALAAQVSPDAEVKPLNDKINILATWSSNIKYPDWNTTTRYVIGDVVVHEKTIYYCVREQPPQSTFPSAFWRLYDQEDKFKRNSEEVKTTVSRLPTYEPCPEHAVSFGGYVQPAPVLNEADKTYEGSSGKGNEARVPPASNTTPGANNSSVEGDPPTDSSTTKDFNMRAFECQLKIHEGVKYVSYLDTENLLTGGIGHLLRADEIPRWPLNSPISEEQVTTWFNQDSASAIKIATNYLGADYWSTLTDVRKRAVADLAFNLGARGLSKFVAFKSAMLASDYNRAGQELRNSRWYTQVGRRGPNIITMITQSVDPNGCDKKFPP